MKNIITALLTTILVLMTSVAFSQTGPCEGQTTYNYDGITYDLIEIGDQCWFSKPIKTSIYTNGTNIDIIGVDNASWSANTNGALSITTSGDYLYNWYAINKGVCPSGYNVPTDADFIKLETELGLKRAERKSFDYRGSGIDFKANWFEAGLEINFAGLRVDNDGQLKEHQAGMYMWTLDTLENENAIDRAIFDYMSFVARHNNLWQTSNNKGHGMLAMCVKNDPDEDAALTSLMQPIFIEPGFLTIETEDFLSASLNVGDTVFIDETLTRNPPTGTTYINARNEILVVNDRGALVYENDFEGQILTTPGGPTQSCGCIRFHPDGRCNLEFVTGPASSSCPNVCQSQSPPLSWSGNATDWKRCGWGANVAPTESEDFKGTIFTTPKGREYQVTRYTNKLYFDNLPNPLIYASQLEDIRAYVDPERRIPYSFEKQYSPSKRTNTIDLPKYDYVIWDDPNDIRHGFRISEIDGYLIEIPIEDIPTGAYPLHFPCQCFSCGGYMGDVQIHNVMVTLNSGQPNCANACANGSLNLGNGEIIDAPAGYGSEPGEGPNCPEVFEPIDPEDAALTVYYPSFGDTTLTYLDQYFTFHVLDTMYMDPQRTIPAKMGTPFVNEYEEIFYADSDGVLRNADYFETLEVRGFYGDAIHGTRSILCCNAGVSVEVVVCPDERGNCKLCEQRGYECWDYSCQITGGFENYSNLTDYLKNSGDQAMVNFFLRNLEFRIDVTKSQVPTDISTLDNLGGIYFDLRYQRDMFGDRNINSVVSLDEDHFNWLVNIPINIDGLYYAFNEDQQLRVSTNGLGEIPDGTMLPTGPFSIKMCLCCCDVWGPYDAATPLSGPNWKTCGMICRSHGCVWADCEQSSLTSAIPPIDNSGGTWDDASIVSEVYISYGDSAWHYNEIGRSLSVFDTLYLDSLKTIPMKQGYHFASKHYGTLFVDNNGVLLTEDLYDGYIISGPDQVTCSCCDCPGSAFGPGENCGPVLITGSAKPCPDICADANCFSPVEFYNCYEREIGSTDFEVVRAFENRLRDNTELIFADVNDPILLNGTEINFILRDSEGNADLTKTKENGGFNYMIDTWVRLNSDYYFLIDGEFRLQISERGIDSTMEIGREWGGSTNLGPKIISICECYFPDCSFIEKQESGRRARKLTCLDICPCPPAICTNPCGN